MQCGRSTKFRRLGRGISPTWGATPATGSSRRDPVLDEITRAITDSGRSLSWIAERSGVSKNTLYMWESGKTRRPQNLTVEFVLRVLGYERITRRMK